MKQKSLLELINCAEQLFEMTPVTKARKKGKSRTLDKEIALCKSAIKMGLAASPVYLQLGVLMRKKGDLGEAVSAFRNALELDSNHYGAHLLLGYTLFEQGKFDAAAEAYGTLVDSLNSKLGCVHAALGETLEKQGKIGGAVKHYQISAGLGYKPAKEWLAGLEPKK